MKAQVGRVAPRAPLGKPRWDLEPRSVLTQSLKPLFRPRRARSDAPYLTHI